MTAKHAKFLALGLGVCLAVGSVSAAMAREPTPEDRTAMMEAIIKSPEVLEKLNGAAIESVEYEGVSTQGHALFEVDTKGCDLDVAFSFDGTNYTMVSPLGACH